MKIVYTDRYRIDIGAHVFPTSKYGRIFRRLVELGVVDPADVVEPVAATWDDLALVHTADYLDKLQNGRLAREEIAQMEIPWSAPIVDGFRLMTGGTIVAARVALGLEPEGGARTAEGSRPFDAKGASALALGKG